MKKLIILLFNALLICGVWSCGNNAKRIKHVEFVPNAEADCTCTHCRILIQPYDDFSGEKSQAVAKQLETALSKHMKSLAVTQVQILPNKPLTEDLMNTDKTRYRANKILDQQQSILQQPGDVIIGLTNSDISTSVHGYEDWGILGLSYLNRNNCIISTYRVKDKSQFWKVVLHEFGHGFLGLPHCPNNDRSCFMVDANGKPNLTPQHHFCDSCSRKIPN